MSSISWFWSSGYRFLVDNDAARKYKNKLEKMKSMSQLATIPFDYFITCTVVSEQCSDLTLKHVQ